MSLGATCPTDTGDIRDRIVAREKLVVLEPGVHHSIDALHLVGEALDRVGQLLDRVVAKMVRLPGLRTEIGHLPKQPLVDLDASALVLGIELAGLAAEILQNSARLEDRDRLAGRPFVIDDGGDAVVRRDRQEFGCELITLGDIDRDHAVRKPALLQHDRDLPAVGRRPVVEVDGFADARRCFRRLTGGGRGNLLALVHSAWPSRRTSHATLPRGSVPTHLAHVPKWLPVADKNRRTSRTLRAASAFKGTENRFSADGPHCRNWPIVHAGGRVSAMLKKAVATALALALVAPLVPVSFAAPEPRMAEAAGPKEKAKPLTPQRQKRKDCAARWPEEKARTGVKGRKAYRKFMRECLKTTAT